MSLKFTKTNGKSIQDNIPAEAHELNYLIISEPEKKIVSENPTTYFITPLKRK